MTSSTPDQITVTRSAEQLRVTTEVVATGRAVLRVRTVTEERLVPVTVTRQEAYLEYLDTPTVGESANVEAGRSATSPWVTLHVDEPVVTVQRVPVERVRLATTWVHEEVQVSAQLAHEEIEVQDSRTPGAPSPA